MTRAILIGVWLWVLIGRVVWAQAPLDEAHEHYRKGTAAYNLGHYAEAASEYEATYKITLDVAVLFNTAQAYRLAGETHEAILAYKGYLRSAPTGPQREVAQQKLDELTKMESFSDPFMAVPVPAPPAAVVIVPIPPQSQQPRPVVTATSATPEAPRVVIAHDEESPQPERPFYENAPFWIVVGAVAVGSVVLVVVAESSGGGAPRQNTTFGSMTF